MKRLITILLGILVSLNTIQAQSWDEITKLLPQNYSDNSYNQFGSSIAIDGDYAVIGAPKKNNLSGLAFVMYNNEGTWEKVAVLSLSTKGYNDYFGMSVSISGDVIVVGKSGNVTGYAYVFVKPTTGWEDMNPTATLSSSDNGRGKYFGRAVSIFEDNILVGSKGADDIGAGYIFEKPVSGWSGTIYEVAKLSPSTGESNGYFGESVSINGDNVVIGARGINDGAGLAYVFTKPSSGWVSGTETATLTASDASANDQFGFSVNILGGDIVIGAHQTDGSLYNSGSAYVFTKPSSGWVNTNETTKLTPSIEVAHNLFGYSTSIYADKIVIGAYNKASVYVFEKVSGAWSSGTDKILTPSDGNNYQFGYSVAISNNKILVGCPLDNEYGIESGSMYSFTEPLSGWVDATENMKTPNSYIAESNFADKFGTSVSIDGDYAVVGAPSYLYNRGCAYILHNNNGVWENIARLTTENNGGNAYFGTSVKIKGEVIVVGAKTYNRKGATFVFEKPTTGWEDMTETAILTASDSENYDDFGVSVGIYEDDIAVGSSLNDCGESNTGFGAVYVFSKPSSGWIDMTETAKLTASDKLTNDNLGKSVDIFGDVIVAGAPYSDPSGKTNAGSAYVFTKGSSGWVSGIETAKLSSTSVWSSRNFGYSVSIFNDDIVIGSLRKSTDVFTKPSTGWENMTETAKLTASVPNDDDRFGYSVSIYENNIVVGAYFNDENGSNSGSAYIYSKPLSGWETSNTESYKLMASDGGPSYYFGTAVAISGETIIIGSPGDLTKDKYSGSASIFEYINTLGSPSEIFNTQISIFPNPTSGLIRVNLKESNIKQIIISDINGREILYKGVNSNSINLNLQDYSKGIYLVHIINQENKVFTKKILKQ